MSNMSLIHSTHKAGPNTEIYGPRSEVRIRVFRNRMVTNQNAGFFKAIKQIYVIYRLGGPDGKIFDGKTPRG